VRPLPKWALPSILIAVIVFGLAVGGGNVDRVSDLGNRIGCPKCDGESAANSPVPTARAIMEVIEEKAAAGWSDHQILEFFSDRYGPTILLDPPLNLSGLLLWSIPVLGLLAGGLVLLNQRGTRPSPDPGNETSPEPSSLRTTALVIGGALVVTAGSFTVGQFLQPIATTDIVAGDITPDLSQISNETLEETIAAFKSGGTVAQQQINAMELALAERYFEEQLYALATDHFQSVLESEPLPIQASEALARLGWILYANGEVSTAEVAYQRALEAFSNNTEAAYFYAILLVSSDRGAEASPFIDQVQVDPNTPQDVIENLSLMREQIGGT
jgi:cytochrome c-type biogenesis protein CcmH/NrfF